jgi:hypothetical protein
VVCLFLNVLRVTIFDTSALSWLIKVTNRGKASLSVTMRDLAFFKKYREKLENVVSHDGQGPQTDRSLSHFYIFIFCIISKLLKNLFSKSFRFQNRDSLMLLTLLRQNI